jgi:hypothetical protein
MTKSDLHPGHVRNHYARTRVGQPDQEDKIMHNYWEDAICNVCGKPFSPEEWEARHSDEDGEDVHEACCPVCHRLINAAIELDVALDSEDQSRIRNAAHELLKQVDDMTAGAVSEA